ncbi:Rhodanese-like protein [Trichodelitschia bisporula]|uniref:M-phase inducer phosphatase n=1 Tax=Trichodelitschia bisporula TaxID=703511 RepID=A0A6G1I250_9PEZI|nr:Rhodanese-like protein [Trichodelitschia bisporula]
MELSSPLAAMAPPPCPKPWGYGRDITSRPLHFLSANFGASSFNFPEVNMGKAQKSKGDYFTKGAPIRGSSPSASLAADLSQNFHIDQSPQLPTPRRALFTTGLFANIDRKGATTPPIPSSSPGFGHDYMDASPLPHKPAFASKLQLFQTAAPKFDVDTEMTSPCVSPDAMDESEQETPVPERRRPSFMMRQTHSRSRLLAGAPYQRPEKPKLPTFTFGAGGTGLATDKSVPSLDECFQASPPQQRASTSNLFVIPPRPRTVIPQPSLPHRANGSPINIQVRKSVATTRPRKLFRRSLSMFENPGDVMNQKKEYVPSGLTSIVDAEETPALKLPHFFQEDSKPGSGNLPRINHDTMISVLDGEYSKQYDKILVIDCRFEYEFEGGHIQGAANYTDKELLMKDLFEGEPQGNALLIFHCEYSAHRAPLMATHIRQQDRAVNAAEYPKLTFPEIYILDGGYSSFFRSHRGRCYPQNYVEMTAKEHENACERGLNRIRQRQKMARAQTFAFGQVGKEMEDSPSRPSSNAGSSSLDLATSRHQARRMASY